MRKLLTVIVLSITLASCNHKLFFAPFEAEKAFSKLYHALKEKDKAGLKELLSLEELSDIDKLSESIDDRIDKLFVFFQGRVLSHGTVSDEWLSESVDDGEQTWMMMGPTVEVSTSADDYEIYFHLVVIDKRDPDSQGITGMEITNSKGESFRLNGLYTESDKRWEGDSE